MMLFMNGYWNDVFWMTSIMVVIVPLVIRKGVKGKKITMLGMKRKSNKKTKNQLLNSSLKANCKICGKSLEDNLLTYCSQSCSFENYLNTQSQIQTKKNTFSISA